MAESCPTCGQAVELHTGSGGTSSYVKAAEVRLAVVRAALEFYADRNKWTQPTSWGGRIFDDEGEATTDCGKVAREALEG